MNQPFPFTPDLLQYVKSRSIKEKKNLKRKQKPKTTTTFFFTKHHNCIY